MSICTVDEFAKPVSNPPGGENRAILCRLYSTLGCHLCEIAEALIAPWEQAQWVEVQVVDVADEPQLFDQYGVRIPVLVAADGAELPWPFDQDRLAEWLHQRLA